MALKSTVAENLIAGLIHGGMANSFTFALLYQLPFTNSP
jgi:hypothetical protein